MVLTLITNRKQRLLSLPLDKTMEGNMFMKYIRINQIYKLVFLGISTHCSFSQLLDWSCGMQNEKKGRRRFDNAIFHDKRTRLMVHWNAQNEGDICCGLIFGKATNAFGTLNNFEQNTKTKTFQ